MAVEFGRDRACYRTRLEAVVVITKYGMNALWLSHIDLQLSGKSDEDELRGLGLAKYRLHGVGTCTEFWVGERRHAPSALRILACTSDQVVLHTNMHSAGSGTSLSAVTAGVGSYAKRQQHDLWTELSSALSLVSSFCPESWQTLSVSQPVWLG